MEVNNITKEELEQLKRDLFKFTHVLNNISFENEYDDSDRCGLITHIWGFCNISSDEIKKECDMWESKNSCAGLQCPRCGKLISYSALEEHHRRYM